MHAHSFYPVIDLWFGSAVCIEAANPTPAWCFPFLLQGRSFCNLHGVVCRRRASIAAGHLCAGKCCWWGKISVPDRIFLQV